MIEFQADQTAWEARRLRGTKVSVLYRDPDNGTRTVSGNITGWCVDYSGEPCMIIRTEVSGAERRRSFIPVAVRSCQILGMSESAE